MCCCCCCIICARYSGSSSFCLSTACSSLSLFLMVFCPSNPYSALSSGICRQCNGVYQVKSHTPLIQVSTATDCVWSGGKKESFLKMTDAYMPMTLIGKNAFPNPGGIMYSFIKVKDSSSGEWSATPKTKAISATDTLNDKFQYVLHCGARRNGEDETDCTQKYIHKIRSCL